MQVQNINQALSSINDNSNGNYRRPEYENSVNRPGFASEQENSLNYRTQYYHPSVDRNQQVNPNLSNSTPHSEYTEQPDRPNDVPIPRNSVN
jgi:hypothetical protein